jgi:hypothetical protein
MGDGAQLKRPTSGGCGAKFVHDHARVAHQTGDTLLAHADAVAVGELGMYARGAVGVSRIDVYLPDRLGEIGVGRSEGGRVLQAW